MPSRTHILDFLLLLVTFLYIIHSHSSKSDRHPPIRNTLTLSISHLVSTRKPSHLSAQHPSKTHNKLYICLLLFMHDIELNPGPRSPKFPCGICHKAVRSNQCGVACDTCNIWHHLHTHVIKHLQIAPQHLMALHIMQHPSSHNQPP